MKHLFGKLALFGATLYTSSFAIFGIGGHYAPNLGAGLDAKTDTVYSFVNSSVVLQQESVKGLSGLGVKFWVDAIPLVDIEASVNLQLSRYTVSLNQDTTKIPLEVDTDLPIIKKASPVAAIVTSDLSVKYPVFKFPPLVSLIKIYVGGGLSHLITPAPLTPDFAKKALQGKTLTSTNDISNAIIDAYKKEGLQQGLGAHVLLGAKAKVPVIPIAIYTDLKYHFGGNLPKGFNNGVTLQLGGALAF